MKIVVDTSVWIAAVLSNRGASYEIFNKALKGEFRVIISHSIYKELVMVIARPEIKRFAKLKDEELKVLKRFLKRLRVKVKNKVKFSRDSKDDMFVQCAVEYGANFILSLDRDLLDLKKINDINLISPRDFLKFLRGDL